MELNELFKGKKIKRDVSDRSHIIGGSNAGAVLGLSTYQSEYQAYLAFVGEAEPVDEKTQARFDMGHALEDFIADQVMRIKGIRLMRTAFAWQNVAHPFLICHPDRMVVGLQEGRRVAVEIKSSSAFDNKRWGDEGTDEIPYDYMVQCYQYFICGVCEEVWLYRFANNQITEYIIKYDEARALKIMRLLVAWVKKVRAGYIPQPMTYKEATSRWNVATDGDMTADEASEELVAKLGDIKAKIKELTATQDEYKTKIVAIMQDKKRLLAQTGEVLCTYTQVQTTRFDSTAFKKDHADLYAQYTKKTTSMRLA